MREVWAAQEKENSETGMNEFRNRRSRVRQRTEAEEGGERKDRIGTKLAHHTGLAQRQTQKSRKRGGGPGRQPLLFCSLSFPDLPAHSCHIPSLDSSSNRTVAEAWAKMAARKKGLHGPQ